MANAATKVRTIEKAAAPAATTNDTIVTVSSKYQIVIPKSVREQMKIKPGQKLGFLVMHGQIKIIPVWPIEHYFGILKGVKIDMAEIRDEEDRF